MSLSSDLMVELAGEEYPLRSSLKAATAVSNQFGGFSNAYQAIARSDLSAAIFVLRTGVPLKAISSDDLAEAAYERGTGALMPILMRYITRLSNGGRDPDAEVTGEVDGEEDDDRGNGEV